jgi:DNA mismatch repair protein MutS
MAATRDELTPMMRQFRRIRDELPADVLLLFRMGDFYEMFFDDARTAAPILGVALTHRAGAPMCGVPYHALDAYLAKLVRAGRKAAICDQMEDPAAAKGIVRREVTRVVTPGTVIEDAILDAARNNYLAALFRPPQGPRGLALFDLSTGDFSVEELAGDDALRDTLRRQAPSECLVAAGQHADPSLAALLRDAAIPAVTDVEDWTFQHDVARDELRRHFQVHSLDGFGCEGRPALIGAAGALLHHVRDELRRPVSHVRSLQIRQAGDCLMLDEATCANLDLVPLRGRPAAATLLGVLDNTRTPMGARRLRNWLQRPPGALEVITARHDAVGCLCRTRAVLNGLREQLGEVRDLERLITRIGSGLGNGRDLRALATSLQGLPALCDLLAPVDDALVRDQAARLHPLPELVDRLLRGLVESPPIALKDGGLIREGYHAPLDELRQMAGDGHLWLARYQAAEQERTGIKTLKVRHNRVFGFYIEVSKGQLDQVPAHYERRQTLVNAERFITPELKDYEQRIFGAQDRACALEYELFIELRDRAAAETAAIQETAAALATLDVLATLADRALALGYVRPVMHTGDELEITAGRHPVIEQLPDAERFVPNDTKLDCRRNQIAVITGPNMAGKSTYIRQVALIAILAHAGSFVPAGAARIPLLDRVFTRVGAGDDLARGRSTFMVEMQETANILNNATARSLIVLDEIGRGTSTFDGISIAWAVAEFLHNTPTVKAKTLFATHYHELTDLALTLNGVRNYSVQVREQGDGIVFLRTIEPGCADKSYGIHVARLAGMPGDVILRAREILANLEEGELEAGLPKLARRSRRREGNGDLPGQLMLFDL